MNVFESVKANVTTRQAAEAYGFKPNRSGLICCPFHRDATPSMKVDRRYYCFGCGVTGDVIDFAAGLFRQSALDAAMRLAQDFGIGYDYRGRASPGRNPKSRPTVKMPEPTPEQRYEKDKVYATRVYLSYLSLLREWKEAFAPKKPDEEWDGRFIEAVTNLDYMEYLTDILLFGFTWEQQELLKDKGKEVIKLDERIKSYRER